VEKVLWRTGAFPNGGTGCKNAINAFSRPSAGEPG